MANHAFASGHILCTDLVQRSQVLALIERLPDSADACSPFAIWRGIFHAPLAPSRAGYIIPFGLSGKYFAGPDEVGAFLNYWENLIAQMNAEQVFMAIEQEFIYSEQPFGKFYFQWQNRAAQTGWVFCGTLPIDENWSSRFETKDSS